MVPFYGWGSTSLVFTTNFPEIPGAHFINLRRIQGPWSYTVVLNKGPLDWEFSTLSTRSLLHKGVIAP